MHEVLTPLEIAVDHLFEESDVALHSIYEQYRKLAIQESDGAIQSTEERVTD